VLLVKIIMQFKMVFRQVYKLFIQLGIPCVIRRWKAYAFGLLK